MQHKTALFWHQVQYFNFHIIFALHRWKERSQLELQVSGNLQYLRSSFWFFSLFMWIFLSLLLSFFLSVCNLRSSAHCVCHPLSTACGLAAREGEREKESCVCYLGGVAALALSSLIRGHWECCSDHTLAALSLTVWTWNKYVLLLHTCLQALQESVLYVAFPPLETFVTVLDAVLYWCDWWHVECSQLVPLTHVCFFFPPPLLARYHGLLDTNSAGIVIVSAFYHIYGQFDWSQLSYQALQQSPIREDPLSPRRW